MKLLLDRRLLIRWCCCSQQFLDPVFEHLATVIRKKSACQAPASVMSSRDVCNIERTLHDGDVATEAVEDACMARRKAASPHLLPH